VNLKLIEISKTQEVAAPIDDVWKIVGDLENEQRHWDALRSVKILEKKNENTVEREATIRRGPMGEAKSYQTLTLDQAKKSSTLTMTKGPMLGTRKIALSSTDGKTTKIEAKWEFELKGIPGFAQGFVKDNISEVTEKALSGIAKEAQSVK
jgi:carbon monoxide dehydrogenase subunit G